MAWLSKRNLKYFQGTVHRGPITHINKGKYCKIIQEVLNKKNEKKISILAKGKWVE